MLSLEALVMDSKSISNAINKTTEFISKQVNKSKLDGSIVAVSGGIDSAVTLSLAVKALGKDKVRAVTMPERDITPKDDVNDVMRLVEVLGVTCDVVDVTPILHVIRLKLPLYNNYPLTAFGNIKTRVRMAISYHYANVLRSMVIGSTNKTEWLTGYFTKYGDGGVDLMPIADFFKTQVRQLALNLDIPSRIIDKTPTAGLWLGQSDEEELGIKYELLDLILYGCERGMNAEEISGGLDMEISEVERVLKRVKINEHKRRLPLILRLSSVRR